MKFTKWNMIIAKLARTFEPIELTVLLKQKTAIISESPWAEKKTTVGHSFSKSKYSVPICQPIHAQVATAKSAKEMNLIHLVFRFQIYWSSSVKFTAVVIAALRIITGKIRCGK